MVKEKKTHSLFYLKRKNLIALRVSGQRKLRQKGIDINIQVRKCDLFFIQFAQKWFFMETKLCIPIINYNNIIILQKTANYNPVFYISSWYFVMYRVNVAKQKAASSPLIAVKVKRIALSFFPGLNHPTARTPLRWAQWLRHMLP